MVNLLIFSSRGMVRVAFLTGERMGFEGCVALLLWWMDELGLGKEERWRLSPFASSLYRNWFSIGLDGDHEKNPSINRSPLTNRKTFSSHASRWPKGCLLQNVFLFCPFIAFVHEKIEDRGRLKRIKGKLGMKNAFIGCPWFSVRIEWMVKGID